jgi:hypothetical protein
MKTILLILALGIFVTAAAQGTNTSGVLAELACKESKRAPSYEAFVEAIKKGERGDEVHQPWMDVMRRLGIKQAFFVVHFSYRNGIYKYTVKEIHYLRRYYCYEGEVTGGKLLRQIRESGLERDLKEAVVARIKRFERPYQPGNVTQGVEYRYLLDDETLSIFDFVT